MSAVVLSYDDNNNNNNNNNNKLKAWPIKQTTPNITELLRSY
jgi:hypothetical protein